MKNFTRLTCVSFLLLFICMSSFAQNKSTSNKKKDSIPDWVKMMDDPNVDYYKAVDAFNKFWKNKEKPVEENEMFETEANEEKLRALNKKRKNSGKNIADEYSFEYKRFKEWQRSMEPFVQEDGHILSMDQRVSAWKKQEELKKQQKHALDSNSSKDHNKK